MFWKTNLFLVLSVALLSGCQKNMIPATETEEEEPVVITRWTENTELFVEFPPLVVGKESPFHAHFTDIETFQPVSSDTVVTILTRKDGHTITAQTPEPIIPGIYRPVIIPDKPGTYRLTFHRSDPKEENNSDTVDVGEVTVAATQDALLKSEEDERDGGITFLKEQQWKIDFATEVVSQKTLNRSLRLHAEVEPSAEGAVEIVAPIGGRIVPVNKSVPAPGQKVSSGEILAMILPLHSSSRSRNELEFAVRSAEAEFKASQKELDRIRTLYKDQIVPKRRLEEAEKNRAVLHARLATARSRMSLLDVNQKDFSNSDIQKSVERFPLRAPIAGTLVKMNMTPGAQVKVGQHLFMIIDLDSVWIEGRLFESDIPKIKSVNHAHFNAESLARPFLLSKPDSRLITIGSVIDPVHRSVPLIMKVNNKAGRLKIGMHGHLSVQTGESITGIAIPKSAVVDDRGIEVAFVHVGGETFERREVTLGIEDEGFVEVKSGLKTGERVVTKMAYRVHLASLSTQLPQHGHAH